MTDMKVSTMRNIAAAGQDRLSTTPRRQQVYIHHDISTGNTFQKSFYLPFKPSSVIVRQLHFNIAPALTDAYILRAMNLDNSILGLVPANNVPVEPGVTIDLSEKHIGSTLNLQLQDLDETATTAAVGLVTALLEFVAD